MSKRLAVAGWTGLVGLLVAAVGISLFVGKMPVGPGEIGDLLLGRLDGPRQALVANLVWGIRWPRILAALACGAALAASGARGLFHLANAGRASWCELASEAIDWSSVGGGSGPGGGRAQWKTQGDPGCPCLNGPHPVLTPGMAP